MRGGFNGHDWGNRGQSAYHVIALPTYSPVELSRYLRSIKSYPMCLKIDIEIGHALPGSGRGTTEAPDEIIRISKVIEFSMDHLSEPNGPIQSYRVIRDQSGHPHRAHAPKLQDKRRGTKPMIRQDTCTGFLLHQSHLTGQWGLLDDLDQCPTSFGS
jgi:hypothetical protein